MVDCAGLENRRAERLRGFESHLLRHLSAQRILIVEGGMRTQFDRRAAAKTERSEAPQGGRLKAGINPTSSAIYPRSGFSL